MDTLALADRYARFWENLSADTLDGLADVMAPGVRFRDPFNDVSGIARVREVFAETYRRLRDVEVRVTDVAAGQEACYLRWSFAYRIGRSRRRWQLDGMTEVQFDDDGRVTAHIDHWDAATQVYEKLPVIGGVLRLLRAKIAA